MLIQRRYFGGGTRDKLTLDSWNSPRKLIHEALEDGTLPFHTILALDAALDTFNKLFGGQIHIARHAALVSRLAYTLLSSLRYANGRLMCQLYSAQNQGPIIAFNVLSPAGDQVGFLSIEKLSSHNFALRTGGMCNPGGVQNNLDFSVEEMKNLFANDKVCGDERDLEDGKNLGVIRISFGASSTVEDVCAFVDFIRGVCEQDGI